MEEGQHPQCEICGYYLDLEGLQESYPTMCDDCQTEQDKFNNSEGKGI
jgi:hypothetical protein